jgi:cytochrome d ubiquinol oxidase subunit II
VPLEQVTAWIMLAALTAYVLMGGADFGAGVWDLLARGPRRRAQRDLISHAIGPIWEANHVWLILVVVLLFTCFPPAFAAIMTALHVPIALVLIGIVLRGSAFTFRAYGGATGTARERERQRWGTLFAVTSLVTPLLLGVSLGTAASGRLRWVDGGYVGGFFEPWLRPFPWSVGAFALAIFAFLAAVYLCAELEPGPLREDFRRRALAAAVAVGVTAACTWALAYRGAQELSQRLAGEWWAWPLQVATALAAVGAIAALWARLFILARALAVAQVALIMLGYGAGTFPYLVVPDFTTTNTAAPPRTQSLVLSALGVGALVLLPSLFYLFRIFKGRRAFAVVDRAP